MAVCRNGAGNETKQNRIFCSDNYHNCVVQNMIEERTENISKTFRTFFLFKQIHTLWTLNMEEEEQQNQTYIEQQ